VFESGGDNNKGELVTTSHTIGETVSPKINESFVGEKKSPRLLAKAQGSSSVS